MDEQSGENSPSPKAEAEQAAVESSAETPVAQSAPDDAADSHAPEAEAGAAVEPELAAEEGGSEEAVPHTGGEAHSASVSGAVDGQTDSARVVGEDGTAGAEEPRTAVPSNLKSILEAALFAASEPLSLDQLAKLFEEHEVPVRATLKEAVGQLQSEYEGRGVSLVEVASGYRFQIGREMAPWVGRLWEEKPQRYSRAFLETLALIAYRQPITRAEIEDVRGVSVSSNIIKSLSERGWVRVVGHRDVPGKPAIYATTRQFLDYFGLASLDELPPLSELKDIDKLNAELDLEDPGGTPPEDEGAVPAIPIPTADIEPFTV